jgi:hypothetical protein
MALIDSINMFGAAATTAMGCLGLFVPNAAARVSGLTAPTKTAFAEFRATFGGMFVVMGLVPLTTGQPLAYFMAGLIWLGAAFGRLLSVVLDRGYSEVRNFFGIAFEASFGMLLLVGSPLLRLT